MPAQATRRQLAQKDKAAAQRFVKNRLQYLRERHRENGGLWLTLTEVGTLRGLSESAIARHESNNWKTQRQLSQDDVLAYAEIYKVEPHEIFEGLTKDKPPKRDQ